MDITIIGTRGIPATYGGFETFAEELAKRLVAKSDMTISVICDCDSGMKNDYISQLNGVKLFYSKYSKTKNPLKYYFDSILMASKNSDIILACGLGGGFWSFIPRLKNKILITNPDGLEWKRQKFSIVKKILIRLLAWFSVKFSHHMVCDSKGITDFVSNYYKCPNKLTTIEYGAEINEFNGIANEASNKILTKYGISSSEYALVVARLEPENNIREILKGYIDSNQQIPLVIVGNLLENKYVKNMLDLTRDCASVKFVGGVYIKEELAVLRANAGFYIHGHSVGGTNPSLLEAMGSANICVCHDNVFNREVVGVAGYYFKDSIELIDILNSLYRIKKDDTIKHRKDNVVKKIKEYYNWQLIADRYYSLFKKLM